MKTPAGILALLGMLSSPAFGADKPSIVIFLADDSGWGDYATIG
jgi:hypothetical protein